MSHTDIWTKRHADIWVRTRQYDKHSQTARQKRVFGLVPLQRPRDGSFAHCGAHYGLVCVCNMNVCALAPHCEIQSASPCGTLLPVVPLHVLHVDHSRRWFGLTQFQCDMLTTVLICRFIAQHTQGMILQRQVIVDPKFRLTILGVYNSSRAARAAKRDSCCSMYSVVAVCNSSCKTIPFSTFGTSNWTLDFA